MRIVGVDVAGELPDHDAAELAAKRGLGADGVDTVVRVGGAAGLDPVVLPRAGLAIEDVSIEEGAAIAAAAAAQQ